MQGYDFSNITVTTPLKSLTSGFQRSVGRNNRGRITTRHKGGGEKRSYRMIDFIQEKMNILVTDISIYFLNICLKRILGLNYAD